MSDKIELRFALEDIVFAWSMTGQQSWDRLVDELYDYVLETYGPPF